MLTTADKEALRRMYRQERDKRLRADGNDQYVRITGQLARFADDPHTPRAERPPLTGYRTVACVGGGFAGLVAGAWLREAGFDVRIIEKGGGFGGAWYWNRFPGAQCDTASMVHLPLLEETGHMPTEKYVHGPEILAHCQRIARQFCLCDDALPPDARDLDALLAAVEDCDFEKMEEIRARADAVVTDPVTAHKLKAWYRQLRKRPCFHDEYLQAYNNPSTHLVDTDGKGAERITKTGVVAAGREFGLDCVIYASGFEVGTAYARRAGFEVTGRGGRTLTEHWAGGCARCTGFTCAASRTCSSSSPRRERT